MCLTQSKELGFCIFQTWSNLETSWDRGLGLGLDNIKISRNPLNVPSLIVFLINKNVSLMIQKSHLIFLGINVQSSDERDEAAEERAVQ